MSDEKWIAVTKESPCPACGKPDWCAWTPNGRTLKCERTNQAPRGMFLWREKDAGGLFRRNDDPSAPRDKSGGGALTPNAEASHISRQITETCNYQPFPVDILPEPIRSFVTQASESVGCDSAFVALPLLAGLASAIGNARRIQLKGDWNEPTILWACFIGNSGTQKTPALKKALRSVRHRQHEAVKQFQGELKIYRDEMIRHEMEMNTWKKAKGEGLLPEEPIKPVLKRYLCKDITTEALAVLLEDNWRGILMAHDELAGWIAGFDRYTQHKGGDMAKWLEMFGGYSIMVDRKTSDRQTIYVPSAAVSVTGGIQLETLKNLLGRSNYENGFASRLLLAYPPQQVRGWTETEVSPEMEQAVNRVFEKLYSLEPSLDQEGDPIPSPVKLSPKAKNTWICFYNEHAKEHAELSGDLSAAWAKLKGYAARLSLVIHYVRWAVDDSNNINPDEVDETSVETGIALSRWFGQETKRVYSILNETDTEKQNRELMELVQRKGGNISTRELMRSSQKAYPTSEISEAALNRLAQAGIGEWESNPPTDKGGRPTRRFILTQWR